MTNRTILGIGAALGVVLGIGLGMASYLADSVIDAIDQRQRRRLRIQATASAITPRLRYAEELARSGVPLDRILDGVLISPDEFGA